MQQANLMVHNMEKELGRDVFDVSTYLFACTLDMVCGKFEFMLPIEQRFLSKRLATGTTLGYNVGVQSGQNQDYLEGIEKYVPKVNGKDCWFVFLNYSFLIRSLTMIAQRIVNVWHHFDFIYKRTKTYRIERKYLDIAEDLPNRVDILTKILFFCSVYQVSILSLQIIKSKKEEFFARSEKDQDKESDENENYKTPQIFIEQLFKLYKKKLVDDTMIKDQVNLLIFGV